MKPRVLPEILKRYPPDGQSRFPLERVDLRFANGAERCFDRLLARGRGAVVIVPVLSNQEVLLVREYAAGLHAYELGLPKGRIEADESIVDAANRELKEEAGYGARVLTEVHRLTLVPTYMTHLSHVVVAEDLYPERLPGDEPEELEVVPWPWASLDELLLRDDVTEGRTIAALYIAREFLRRNGRGPV